MYRMAGGSHLTRPKMNKAILQRALISLTAISWGAVLVYFYASGRIVKYLAPDFRLIALIGGLGLLVIGLFVLLTATQTADCGHDHSGEDDPSHEALDLPPVAAFLILLLPIGLSLAWTEDAYSVEALTRKGLNDSPASAGELFLGSVLPPLTREIIEQQHPLDAEGYREFRLMELFFASGDPEMSDLIDGMQIAVEGRLVADTSEHAPPNQFKLYRLFMTCCAADSRTIPITAQFPEGVPGLASNTWVRLSGKITYPDLGRGIEPILTVDFYREKPAPAEESFMRNF